MKQLTSIAKAISVVATRLGLDASVRAKSLAMDIVVSPIKLAYELGTWILRIEREDGFNVNDGVGVLNEMFVSFFKNLTDTAGVAEDLAWSFNKALHDEAGLTDKQIMDFFKSLVDEAHVLDKQSMAFHKELTDGIWVTDDLDGEATIADEQTMSFTKGRTDQSFVSDEFIRVVQYRRNPEEQALLQDLLTRAFIKSLSDTSWVTDEVTRSMGKDRQDTGFVSDVANHAVGKALQNTAGALDAPAKGFTKAPILDAAGAMDQVFKRPGLGKADSASITDTGSLRSQGYCEFSYFAEDFVGASRTF